MIVELFGPPGAGKTTFARTLVARLDAASIPTALLLSYRPAEEVNGLNSDRNHQAVVPLATLRRLSRPAVELLGATCRQFMHRSVVGTTGQLLTLMPPQEALWAIRLRQYLMRLERAWQSALGAGAVLLCDQGFLQAVASLLVLGTGNEPASLSSVLGLLPAAGLRVRLDVPIEILIERLKRRYQEQGRFERLLELDLTRNLAFVPALTRLDAALGACGLLVLRVGCSNQAEMEVEAERVVPIIGDTWRAAQKNPT